MSDNEMWSNIFENLSNAFECESLVPFVNETQLNVKLSDNINDKDITSEIAKKDEEIKTMKELLNTKILEINKLNDKYNNLYLEVENYRLIINSLRNILHNGPT